MRQQQHQIILADGSEISVQLKQNPRAKRMILRFDLKNNQPRLTVPPFTPMTRIDEFLACHQDWLQQQINAINRHRVSDKIYYKGELYQICHCPDQRGGVMVDEPTKSFRVSGDQAFLHSRMVRFLKKQAGLSVKPKAKQIAERIGKTPKHITIRNQYSRWGSCSSQGGLNFNWRLIMCPPSVEVYVIAHEVAHMRHMDHSHRFWALVGELHPSYQTDRQWLRQNGDALICYG